jgi:hypothetical protein
MALAATRGGQLAGLQAGQHLVSPETVLGQVDDLARVRAPGLPPGLSADCSERHVEAGPAWATGPYRLDLAAAPRPVLLLAALC